MSIPIQLIHLHEPACQLFSSLPAWLHSVIIRLHFSLQIPCLEHFWRFTSQPELGGLVWQYKFESDLFKLLFSAGRLNQASAWLSLGERETYKNGWGNFLTVAWADDSLSHPLSKVMNMVIIRPMRHLSLDPLVIATIRPMVMNEYILRQYRSRSCFCWIMVDVLMTLV
jgi:hypothetical protein